VLFAFVLQVLKSDSRGGAGGGECARLEIGFQLKVFGEAILISRQQMCRSICWWRRRRDMIVQFSKSTIQEQDEEEDANKDAGEHKR
jgi:hypothetical protein